jgi:hypothetical protein
MLVALFGPKALPQRIFTGDRTRYRESQKQEITIQVMLNRAVINRTDKSRPKKFINLV